MTDRAPIDPQVAVDYMLQTAPRYAAAKAKRVQLEEFRKSKKAILMWRTARPPHTPTRSTSSC
jgi:hypothetical protein